MTKNLESEVGIKNDNGKAPLALIPTKPLLEIARVLDFGRMKYSSHNWRNGIEQERLLSAALRHILANNEGENKDEESGLNHLAHACCCLLFALEQQLREETYSEFDDRFIAKDNCVD